MLAEERQFFLFPAVHDVMPEEELERRGRRELRRAAEAAVGRLELAVQAGVGLVEQLVAERAVGQAAAVQQGVQGSTDYDALKDCDWVIEAATENLALKRRIFAQVEARVGVDTAITSNTSSLPAGRIFAELKHPERATVTHFFAPAWRNPAVEVIAWPHAAPELVAWLRWVFCTTGKVPLLTSDAPCFMLDRIFDNWCNESALLLERASAAQIDTVATEFVHAGPFFVLNLARGNPIITETNTLQADEEGEHYRPAPIFQSVEQWLTLPPGRRVEVPPETASAVRDRLLGVLLSQSVDILDRGIGTPADLDLGCRTALGFKNGPLTLLRDMPEAQAQRILKRLALERAGMPMPKRALPDYLKFERHVLVDDVQGVKVITLRRPEALNALHDEMTDEILALIRRFEDDPEVSGFVITGYGTTENETRAKAAGVTDFMRKPLSPEMIEESAAHAMRSPVVPMAARLELVQPSEVHVELKAPAVAHPVRQIALFLAAPFIGLAYAVAMPLVGLAALLWIGGKALLQTQAAKHAPMFLKNVALLAAAPFIGLLYAMALPFVGMGFLVVTAAKALASSRYAPTMTRFLGYAAKLIAAPFVGLAFAVMLPLVGTAMLFWVAGKALMTRAEVA